MEPPGYLVDHVEDIVEAETNIVDVLGLHRRNEGPVEPRQSFMRDVVAFVFDLMNPNAQRVPVGFLRCYALIQHFSSLHDQLRLLLKEIEELLVFGEKFHIGPSTFGPGAVSFRPAPLHGNLGGAGKPSIAFRQNRSSALNRPV